MKKRLIIVSALSFFYVLACVLSICFFWQWLSGTIFAGIVCSTFVPLLAFVIFAFGAIAGAHWIQKGNLNEFFELIIGTLT